MSAFRAARRRLALQQLEARLMMAGDLRTPMMGEGYLALDLTAGFERVGHTDVRNPAVVAAEVQKDELLGYDWSSLRVHVHTTIAEDLNEERAMHPGGILDKDGIREDVNFANQVYQQAGLTVILPPEEWAGVKEFLDLTFPLAPSQHQSVTVRYRSENGDVVNVYYVQAFDDDTEGIALAPNDTSFLPNRDGFIVVDEHELDVFAHELGHFLLGSSSESTTLIYEHVDGEDTQNLHSQHLKNVMARGEDRETPADEPIQRKSTENSAPSQPGRHVRALGQLNRLEDFVFDDENDDNDWDEGDEARYMQIEAMHESRFIRRGEQSRAYGERVDFLWVEDNFHLENIVGADATLGVSEDFLKWKIGTLASPPDTSDMEFGDWMNKTDTLPAGAFTGDFFNVVDVFAQVARYSDNDVDFDFGHWSPEESARDYKIEFSVNGSLWVDGIFDKVFKDGWTDESMADDFVVRWKTDIAAQFVRITPTNTGDDDRNTQIDAIIAAKRPDMHGSTYSGSIGDYVWYDTDADGMQDAGEAGAADVQVRLVASSGDWMDTWTNASGFYQFNNIAPGNYHVEFANPVNYAFTSKDAGGNDALDSDANSAGVTATFTVGTSAVTTIDAGLVAYPWASVGNYVWQDNDQDGVQDAGEPGVAGAVVKLYTSQGTLINVESTSETGVYSFTDVEPGDYYVKFELPWGYKAFSPKDAGGNDALDSDANSSGQTVTFSLASGANNTSIDCGLIDNASPVAANDTAYVVHDRTLNVSAPGLLSNDTDTESDSLHAELVNDPTYGSVTLNTNGSYVYTPPSAWTGVDTFTYRVWDGYQWSNTATVTVNVTNMQPSTSANSYVTPSSGPLVVAAPGVLGNDGDSDGDTLTASLVTNVSQGTLSFLSNGGFTYTKPSGFSGVVFFSYKAFDGVAYSNTTTVGITVSPSFLTLDGDEKEAEAGAPSHVTKEQVRDLMHEAIARWHDAGADRQELRERWQDLNLHVFDLPDNRLAAQAGDDIVIDINAAGHGWFVDETATHDGDFPIFVADTERKSEEPGADATGSVDLLAALMHEAGHWLGLPHYEPGEHPHNVMLDTLPLSTRRVPADGQGDVQPLRLEGQEQDTRTKLELRPTDLRPFVRIAAAYWTEQGVSREDVQRMKDTEIFVTDLPDGYAGVTTQDGIWIDIAGLRRREVFAVTTHELGHVVGYDHADGGIMSGTLRQDRRAHDLAFELFSEDEWRI